MERLAPTGLWQMNIKAEGHMTISNIENHGSKYMEMTRNRIGLHIGEKPHKIKQ